MSRLQWIKKERHGLSILLLVTLALPFMKGIENSAGCNPLTIFGSITILGWIGVIGILCSGIEYRR